MVVVSGGGVGGAFVAVTWEVVVAVAVVIVAAGMCMCNEGQSSESVRSALSLNRRAADWLSSVLLIVLVTDRLGSWLALAVFSFCRQKLKVDG